MLAYKPSAHVRAAKGIATSFLKALANKKPALKNLATHQIMRKHLSDKADIEFQKHKNSWKTAMYQCLANDDWFCQKVTKFKSHKTKASSI